MPGYGSLIEHERMRWGYMTEQQQITRLSRIRKVEKLRCFIVVAEEEGTNVLLQAAYRRANALGFTHLVPNNVGEINEILTALDNRSIPAAAAKWESPEDLATLHRDREERIRKLHKKKKPKDVRVIRFKKGRK
jgi:hypothetical protein